MLDNVIQNVTSIAFRTFGRAILQNGGLGGSGARSGGEQRVSVVLPTFPPDDYDEDEDSDSDSAVNTASIIGVTDVTTTGNSIDAVGLSNEQDETSSTESTTIASSSLSSDSGDANVDSSAPFTVRDTS